MGLKNILNIWESGDNMSLGLSSYPNHFNTIENGGFNYSTSVTPLFDGVTKPGTNPTEGIVTNLNFQNFQLLIDQIYLLVENLLLQNLLYLLNLKEVS